MVWKKFFKNRKKRILLIELKNEFGFEHFISFLFLNTVGKNDGLKRKSWQEALIAQG